MKAVYRVLGGIAVCVLTSCAYTAGFRDGEGELKAIEAKISTLRQLSDADRAVATKELALRIRRLPAGPDKPNAAVSLANLATEGDFGPGTLQEVTTTLVEALRETPIPTQNGQPYMGYDELAQLAKYEHMKVALRSREFTAAVQRLDAIDGSRQKVDFTLSGIDGRTWTLSQLKGKVVLVNFWATWCPPCRKEMPDLQALCDQFKDQGLVILSISNEPAGTVKAFITQHGFNWPILLDPGSKVNARYSVTGIPKSFLYGRDGKLIDQTIDMRTRKQFMTLFAEAGLK